MSDIPQYIIDEYCEEDPTPFGGYQCRPRCPSIQYKDNRLIATMDIIGGEDIFGVEETEFVNEHSKEICKRIIEQHTKLTPEAYPAVACDMRMRDKETRIRAFVEVDDTRAFEEALKHLSHLEEDLDQTHNIEVISRAMDRR